MTLDPKDLERRLHENLRREVGVDSRPDGSRWLRTPFAFPDGDRYPIRLTETPDGRLRLSDCGHTMMHLGYEHEVDDFLEGVRGMLLERVMTESELEWDEGAFVLDTTPERLSLSLFRFGQALTRICDLAFLSRPRVESTPSRTAARRG